MSGSLRDVLGQAKHDVVLVVALPEGADLDAEDGGLEEVRDLVRVEAEELGAVAVDDEIELGARLLVVVLEVDEARDGLYAVLDLAGQSRERRRNRRPRLLS